MVHLFQDAGQHPGLTTGLEEKVDLAVGGAFAQHPHVQAPGNEAHYLGYAAVLGQIVKAGQGKQDMPILAELGQRPADFLKLGALPDHPVGQRRRRSQCPGAAQGVQNKNLLFRIFFQHHLPGGHSGVVAAGKIAADGHGNDLVGLQEPLGPFLGTGAGGRGCTVVIGHRLDHLRHVQGGQIYVLTLSDADLEWNQCKLHPGRKRRQFPDVTRSVGYNHPCHGKPSRHRCRTQARLYQVLVSLLLLYGGAAKPSSVRISV